MTAKRTTRKAARDHGTPVLKLVPPPAVCDAKVEAARKRIAAGWYDRPEVKRTLARAVLDELLSE